MALEHPVSVGGLTVTVKELTVGQVRDWALKVDAGLIQVDPVRHLALDECSIQDIVIMSDAEESALDALAPSEFVPLVDACRKLNPHFFRVRAAMSGAAMLMADQAQRTLLSEPA